MESPHSLIAPLLRGLRRVARVGVAMLFFVSVPVFAAADTNAINALKPHQILSLGPAPQSPAEFNPDAGVPPSASFLRPLPEPALTLELKHYDSPSTDLPPLSFNPDVGALLRQPKVVEPFFKPEFTWPPPFGSEPVPESLRLPRGNLRRYEIVETNPAAPAVDRSAEPLPETLKLPRANTRANEKIEYEFRNPDYPLSRQGRGYPTNTLPAPDRWRTGFTPWRRYTDGRAETPYETPQTLRWHPYLQSRLKGDAPIIGSDIFLNLTATADTIFEARRLPTPSGVSGARSDNAEFFGRSEQLLAQNNLAFAVELFRGEAAFKPVHWAIKLQPVFNLNYVDTRETGLVNADPRGGRNRNNALPPDNSMVTNPGDIDTLLNGQVYRIQGDLAGTRHTRRLREYFALQEAFAEVHLGDLSDNYDFMALRAGNQVFNSDFRGFIFNDVNLGARFFGNAANNHWQYNVVALDLNEKDSNSDLNTFDRRDQRVFIANVYRQDFLWHGYTAQLSFHANLDQGGTHYDRNDNIVRPAPFGTVREHDVRAYYLGWAGDGHIGRLNLSHAFYQVFGRDDFNGLAGRAVDINAQMAALELSYDRDWIRYSASFFYASGDGSAEDSHATGFDTILDNPNFTGGPFSYYVRQGFNLAGTAVAFKQRNSLVPNLRTSKTEGQANFVNPGLFLYGVGASLDVTPKLRGFFNANYLRFAETDPVQTALLTDKVRSEIGYDLSLGVQYRPLLTDNIIISAGFGALIPGSGYRDIYRRSTDPVPGFNATNEAGKVDDFLYSALFAVTFTY